jgi:hypothetical protein
VAALVIGAFLLLIGVIAIVSPVIDWLFERFSAPYISAARGLGWSRPEWRWEWSRRLTRISAPVLFFLTGIVTILKGAGVLE